MNRSFICRSYETFKCIVPGWDNSEIFFLHEQFIITL